MTSEYLTTLIRTLGELNYLDPHTTRGSAEALRAQTGLFYHLVVLLGPSQSFQLLYQHVIAHDTNLQTTLHAANSET